MEIPARNTRRNITEVGGSANFVRITTTSTTHVFCLLCHPKTDCPSEPWPAFRRPRTPRGVIALTMEDNRDAESETNGGVILWHRFLFVVLGPASGSLFPYVRRCR